MRIWRLTSQTGIEALVPQDAAIPQPGRRQVLVKVAAASLNYRDLAIATGRYRAPTKPNVIPLSDGAGTVVETGGDVQNVKTGDRVMGCFFQRWIGGDQRPDTQASALGGGIDGMLAEYVVLEEDGIVKTPAHLTDAEASALPCAALTAWHALVEHGHLTAGQTILVQGTGGVSIFALQFARMMGANVIVTSSSEDKLRRAMAMGAAHGINYRTVPDWDRAATEITGGRGVDQVVEVGGPGTFARSLGAIRTGGKISLIGVLSGMAEINPGLILAKRANVQGISVGSTSMFEAMSAAISTARLKPVIDRVFAMAQTREAYAHLQGAGHFGKIVLSIG